MPTPAEDIRTEPAAAQPARELHHRRFDRDALINVAGVVVSGVAGLVMVPVLLRYWGAGHYGIWITAFAAAQFGAVFNYGLGRTLTRFVPQCEGEEQRRLLAAARSAYVLMALLAALVVAAAGLLFARPLHFPIGEGFEPKAVFTFFALALPLQALTTFAVDSFIALRRFAAANATLAGFTIVRAAAIMLAVVAFGFGPVRGAALGLLVAGAVAAVVTFVFRQRVGPLPIAGPRAAWSELRKAFGFAAHTQLIDGANQVLWEAPTLVLSAIAGPVAAAIYYVGARFPLALATISSRAADTAMPWASAYRDLDHHTRDLLVAGTRSVLALTLPIAYVLYQFAPDLLRTWTGAAQPESVAVLRLMAVGVAIEAVGATAMQVLWGREDVRKVFYSTAAGAVLSLVATVLLVMKYGVPGSGMAFVAAMVFVSFAYTRMALHAAAMRLAEFTGGVARALQLPAALTALLAWAWLRLGWHGGGFGWLVGAAAVCATFWTTWYLSSARTREVTHA